MNKFQADFLREQRRIIAEWQEHMDTMQEGDFRLLNGRDEDVTAAHMEHLAGMIARLEAFVQEHDPEGLTVLGSPQPPSR